MKTVKFRPPVRQFYSRTEALLDLTFLLACCHAHYSWTETPGYVSLAVNFEMLPDAGLPAEVRTFAEAVSGGDVDGARLGVYEACRRWLQASPRWKYRCAELQSIGFPSPPQFPL